MCFFEALTTLLLFVPPSLSFAIDLLLPPQCSPHCSSCFLRSYLLYSSFPLRSPSPWSCSAFLGSTDTSLLYLHLKIGSLEQQMIVNMWSLPFCVWTTSLRTIFPRNRHSPANSIIKERMKRIKIKKIKVSNFFLVFRDRVLL